MGEYVRKTWFIKEKKTKKQNKTKKIIKKQRKQKIKQSLSHSITIRFYVIPAVS